MRHIAFLKKISPARIVLILVSLSAFILALTLMKEGAGSLAPQLEETFKLSGLANSLGFGWLAAILIFSGSPIAATALAFFDSEAIHALSALAMIMGSRIGAAFVVLVIGLIYVIRGRDRTTSLGIGLLSLLVSATTYLLALPVGIVLLKSGALDWATVAAESAPFEALNRLFTPVAKVSVDYLGHLGTFFAGLGFIILSLNLFDRALPDMDDAEEESGPDHRPVYRPWAMFLAGAAVTLVSLSVTISLSILVPLNQHRIVRLKYLVPYIMGANITTLIDTLFAAAVMDNSQAVPIVLADFAGITLVSIAILVTVYRRYEKLMLDITGWATAHRLRLLVFMGIFFLAPLVLLLT